MTDQAEDIAVEPDLPESDSDFVDDETEQLDDGDIETPVDDDEEIEHEGQKYRIPKALKPALMMQADYTQKTQQLAEQRKTFEVQQAQQQQTIQQNIDDIATIRAIENRLTYLNQIDLRALSENDPLQTQQFLIEQQQLNSQRQNVINSIQNRNQQQAQAQQQHQAQLLEQGNAVLAKELPGWGKELATKIMTFAKTDLGYSEQELQQITDPRIVKTLHAAMVGQQVLSKQKPAAKQVADAKPVKTVGKSSTATKDPSRMSTDEWMKARNAQLNKRRAK